MAEALALLGLVCNILQLIQVGYTIGKGAKEIYVSPTGTTEIARDIRLLLEDIQVTARDIRTEASNPLSGDEKAIKEYCGECEDIVAKLLVILAAIEPRPAARGRSRKRTSIKIAAYLALKKGEIGRLMARLQNLDERLRQRLSNIMDVRRHSSTMASLHRLNAEAIILKKDNHFRLNELRDSLMRELLSKGDLEHLKQSIESLADESKQVSKTLAFFKTLRFPEIQHRFSDIVDAHKRTIKWAFDKSHTTLPGWLENESGIYWITGVAGSGKSTYMKYLVSHPSTSQKLRAWAGNNEVSIASFFFWNLGLPMQKSEQGLFQTLLFQVLRENLDLIEELCPDRDNLVPWTRRELAEVFDRISSFDFGSKRFCFFIDGLDEYDGEEDDVIQTIRKLASCPNIKVCISSRPWNAFQDAFGDSAYTLAMETLTEKDINEYIQLELTSNKLFEKCMQHDPRFGSTSDQLTKRAKGVWLWVHLIVKGLKRDLRSRETFEHWQTRIDSVPPDLEAFFRRMLARLDPIHKTQTARTFLTVLRGEQMGLRPFTTDMYSCFEQEATDPQYLNKMPFLKFEAENDYLIYKKRQNKTDSVARVHINDRCRDLLHVKGEQTIGLYRNRLEFLHRTARDFFRDTYYEELERAAGAEFTPAKSIVQMYLAMLKIHPLRHRYLRDAGFDVANRAMGAPEIFEQNFTGLLSDFWSVISQHEALFEPDVIDKFDELASQRMTKQWVTIFHTGLFDEVFYNDSVRMIAWCLCMRLGRYVQEKWQPGTYSTFLELEWSPLRVTLPRNGPDQRLDIFPTRAFSEELLQFVLDNGGSPNEPHFVYGEDARSVSHWFLRHVCRRSYLNDDASLDTTEILDIEECIFKALQRLIKAGLEIPPGYNEDNTTFQDRLAPVFGETRASLLLELYQQNHQRSTEGPIPGLMTRSC